MDAHLRVLLQAAGHDARHTAGLPEQNKTPDRVINELSVAEQRVDSQDRALRSSNRGLFRGAPGVKAAPLPGVLPRRTLDETGFFARGDQRTAGPHRE